MDQVTKSRILKHTISTTSIAKNSRTQLERILQLLSGDLNYDQIAEAKKIVRDLLSTHFRQ